MCWIGYTGHFFFICQYGSIVINSVRGKRPSVILTFFHKVQLIAPSWTVLYCPYPVILFIIHQTLWVSMSVRPYRCPGAGSFYKWVVVWHAAVIFQPVNFSMIIVQIPYLFHCTSFSGTEEHVIVFVKNDPAAEMVIGIQEWLCVKKILFVNHIITVKLKTGYCCS